MVPLSLLNFLRQPNYTFVGCGIKDNFANLEKHYYGIGCKNAVELGTLAATIMDEPHLRFCGVDELAFEVNELDLRKDRPLSLAFSWGLNPLSEELAKLATVHCLQSIELNRIHLFLEGLLPLVSYIDNVLPYLTRRCTMLIAYGFTAGVVPNDKVPTRQNILKRRVIRDPGDALCAFCVDSMEAIDHLLVICVSVSPVWYSIFRWVAGCESRYFLVVFDLFFAGLIFFFFLPFV
ncbi:werner syndrome-like exonuclease-like, partial [Trifolium medium]|nr:werner syndrome-like exonuclease-like [Trifolium medium]